MDSFFVIQLENGYFLWFTYRRNPATGMELSCGAYKKPYFATKVDDTCLNEDTLKEIQEKFPGARVVKVQTSFQVIESHPNFPF